MSNQIRANLSLCYEDLQNKLINVVYDLIIESSEETRIKLFSTYWNKRHEKEFDASIQSQFHTLVNYGQKFTFQYIELFDFPEFFDIIFFLNKNLNSDNKRYTKGTDSLIKISRQFIYDNRNNGLIPGAHSKPSKEDFNISNFKEFTQHLNNIYNVLKLPKGKLNEYIDQIDHLLQFGIPNNLPEPTYYTWNGFMGREKLLESIKKLIYRRIKVITLHGPGGVGKTAIARKICDDIKLDFNFSHIIWFSAKETSFDNITIYNKEISTPYVEKTKFHLLSAIVAVFEKLSAQELHDTYLEDPEIIHLTAQKILDSENHNILLVLDNFETVTMAERNNPNSYSLSNYVLNELSESKSIGKIIITSREKLNNSNNERIGNMDKYDAIRFLDNALKGFNLDQFTEAYSNDRILMHKIANNLTYNPIRLAHLVGWIKNGISLAHIIDKISNSGLDEFTFGTSLRSLNNHARDLLFTIHHVNKRDENLRYRDIIYFFGSEITDDINDALDMCKDFSCLSETNGVFELTAGLENYLPKWAEINYPIEYASVDKKIDEWLDEMKISSENYSTHNNIDLFDLKHAHKIHKLIGDKITHKEGLDEILLNNPDPGPFSCAVAAMCSFELGKVDQGLMYAKKYFTSNCSFRGFNNDATWINYLNFKISRSQCYFLIAKKSNDISCREGSKNLNIYLARSILICWSKNEDFPFNITLEYTEDQIIEHVYKFVQRALNNGEELINDKNHRFLKAIHRIVLQYLDDQNKFEHPRYQDLAEITFSR